MRIRREGPLCVFCDYMLSFTVEDLRSPESLERVLRQFESAMDGMAMRAAPGQNGSSGDLALKVDGAPGSVVDGHLAVFDGTTGTKIKDGGPAPTAQVDTETLVPFNAGLFTASAGVVTVGATGWNTEPMYNGYRISRISGRFYRVSINLTSVSFSADATVFNIGLPAGMVYDHLLFQLGQLASTATLLTIATNNPDFKSIALTKVPFTANFWTVAGSPWSVLLDFVASIVPA
jgi:hypothetical protein